MNIIEAIELAREKLNSSTFLSTVLLLSIIECKFLTLSSNSFLIFCIFFISSSTKELSIFTRTGKVFTNIPIIL